MSNSLKNFWLAGDIRHVEIDARVGGKFCFSDMRNCTEAVHHGTNLELDMPRRIVFNWMVGDEEEPNPSKVTQSIEPTKDGCQATIVHEMDAQWAEYVSRTSDSWGRMLRAIEDLG